MPGAALSYIVLGAVLVLGIAWFPGDLETGRVSAWAYFAFVASALVVGVAGVLLAWREGRYAPARPHGWLPIEVRSASRTEEGLDRRVVGEPEH